MNLPKLPSHPEHNHSWTRPELAALSEYGQACALATASEPKAFCGDCGKRNSGVHTCSPQYAVIEQKPVAWISTNRVSGATMLAYDKITSRCDSTLYSHLALYAGAAPAGDSARIKHLTQERDGLHAAMAQIAVYSKTEWPSGAACDMREIARAALAGLGEGAAS